MLGLMGMDDVIAGGEKGRRERGVMSGVGGGGWGGVERGGPG